MYRRFGKNKKKKIDYHEINVFMSCYVKQVGFCSQRGAIASNLISVEMQTFALLQMCWEIQIERPLAFPALQHFLNSFDVFH